MIAVAQDHAFEIALPPVLEIEVVVLGIFVACLPAVERFVNDEHAEAIAGIEEISRGRVVAGADGVVAVCFQDFHSALFGTGNTG